MSGTTNIGDLNVRVRSRYAFLLALLTVDAAAPLVLSVVLPTEMAQEIRVWHLLGLLAIPAGVVLLIFAIMDRFRMARAMLIRPKNKRVREAWRVARINLALATVIPLSLATALTLKALPEDVRDQAFGIINKVLPGTAPGSSGDKSAPAENAPPENAAD